MDSYEHDTEAAGDQPMPIPRWWAMPYPTEPLYPVDFFVAAKGARRRRFRLRSAQARAHATTPS